MSAAGDDALRRLHCALTRVARLPTPEEPVTPSAVIAETDNATLRRFGEGSQPPLLVIYSLVNRPQILDLSPQRSVLRHLAAGGHSVYLLDWHPPGQARRFLGLEDYICGDIADATAMVSARHGGQAPDLLGVCQGGVLALCHAALAPGSLRRLALLATPVDTGSARDPLARLARGIDFERLVRASGNIGGPTLASIFASLKPFALGIERYADLAGLADAREETLVEFLRMERWMYDGPDQAGRAFAEFAREVYQRNALARGELRLGGEAVRLGAIRAPVYSAYALDDHLVPPAAARALPALLGGPCTEQALPGGHLGLFISRQAHQRLYPRLLEWLDRPG